MRRLTNRTALGLTSALFVLAIGGCGSDGEEGAAAEAERVPAPEASSFPAPKGDLDSLTAEVTPTDQYVVSPAGKVYDEGRTRFSFGVYTVDGEQLEDAEVAIYAAPGPDGEAKGPFPARIESLETDPGFVAQTTSGDPDAAKVVYVTELDLDEPGEWRMVAVLKRDDELIGTLLPSIEVGADEPVPDVGEPAPVVHTPTVDDVGDISEIDTRVPPSSLHDVDFADVVGEKPAVLLFATPALCTSRVCGPVVDVAEQVKRDTGDEVAFVYQEIYEDNDPNKGPRQQVRAYHLPSEPWLFVVDCDGKISTRIEGAFSVSELTEAVETATAKPC